MGEEYRVKVFKSGNSLALRLPKALGMVAGTEMRLVCEADDSLRIAPVEQPRRKIDISGFWGKVPGLQPPRPEDRVFEDRPSGWRMPGLEDRE